MGTTAGWQIPYPEVTDPPDGAGQMRVLAERVDAVLFPRPVLSTARPTPTPGAMIFETDTNRIWVGARVAGVNWWVPLPGTKMCLLRATTPAQSFPNVTTTEVVWGANNGDPFGFCPAGSSKITPKFPGHYQFTGTVSLVQNATGYRAVSWYSNNMSTSYGTNISTQPASIAGLTTHCAARSYIHWLNGTSDFMALNVFHNAGIAVTAELAASQESTATVVYLGPGKDTMGGSP